MQTRTQSSPLAFDALDFKGSRVFIVVAGLFAAVVLLAVPVARWFLGDSLRVTVPVDEPVEIWGRMGESYVVSLALEAPTMADRVLALSGSLYILLLIVGGLALLWRFLGQVERGKAFSAEVVALLWSLALLLMVAPVVGGVAQGFLNGWFLRRLGQSETLWALSGGLALPAVLIGTGLLLALVAHVFGRGIELERDVEGLV